MYLNPNIAEEIMIRKHISIKKYFIVLLFFGFYHEQMSFIRYLFTYFKKTHRLNKAYESIGLIMKVNQLKQRSCTCLSLDANDSTLTLITRQ